MAPRGRGANTASSGRAQNGNLLSFLWRQRGGPRKDGQGRGGVADVEVFRVRCGLAREKKSVVIYWRPIAKAGEVCVSSGLATLLTRILARDVS